MKDHIMNKKPIEFDGCKLTFIATKYQFGGGLAIIANAEDGLPYDSVSINLLDWGYFTEPNEIYLNFELAKDFKEMFCENFCGCTLSSCEKIKFGPYDTETEKVVILDKFLK